MTSTSSPEETSAATTATPGETTAVQDSATATASPPPSETLTATPAVASTATTTAGRRPAATTSWGRGGEETTSEEEDEEETTPDGTTVAGNESEQTSTDGTTEEEAAPATGSETTEEETTPDGTTTAGTESERVSTDSTTENEAPPPTGSETTEETTSDEAEDAMSTTSQEPSAQVDDTTTWEPTTEAPASTTNGTCPCSLPAGTLAHSLIAYRDANVSAQNVYSRMTIGGDLVDGAPGVWKVADGLVLVGGEAETKWWSFNGGISTGTAFDTVFDWSDFQDLARRILPGEYSNGYKVFTVRTGGTYTQDNFTDSDGQAEDNGHTLVVINTDEEVILDRSPSGKAFGPSIFAPFSKVTLLNRAGFIDGFLVALELGSQPNSEGEVDHLQMHGEGYKGPLECFCIVA